MRDDYSRFGGLWIDDHNPKNVETRIGKSCRRRLAAEYEISCVTGMSFCQEHGDGMNKS